MIIRGVFSMSIINRLKSLFKGDNEKEETNITDVVSDTSNNAEVTSPQKVDDPIVSGTKTTVPMNDGDKDLTFKKGIDPVEDSSEEIVEDAPTPLKEVVQEVEAIKDEEETTDEDVVEDSNDKDKKRDTMTLLTDKELLNDSNRDPDFTAEFIDAGIETVKHCFQCGTCSGSCPSGRRTPYKVRQIVRKCLLGLKEEVITDDALWMCTTCYTCQERCLRSVKIVEIIKKARNIAAHAGYMAKPHKMTGVFVMNTGHGVPINDATKALRTKIGLPEIPPTTHAYPEALEEIKTICKLTGFDELIGYDEATGGLKE